MKNHIPLVLAISTLIGLLTLIGATNYLFGSIETVEPPKRDMLVVGKDTLMVSPKLKNIPFLNDTSVGQEPTGKRFYLNVFPATLNWIVFHSMCLSIGAASLLFLFFLIDSLKKRFKIKFRSKESLQVIVPLILVVVITILFASMISTPRITSLVSGAEIMDYFNIIFSDAGATVRSVVLSFFLIGIVPLIGIMMVNISINKLLTQHSQGDKGSLGDYQAIKDSLNIFAFFAGLLLAVAILGTKLQRNMIAEQLSGIESIYPDEFIYGYGMAFTLVLALFFLPSLVFLKYYKNRNLEDAKIEGKSTGWWRIGKESVDDIKLLFSIVLPLLSSLVQSFI